LWSILFFAETDRWASVLAIFHLILEWLDAVYSALSTQSIINDRTPDDAVEGLMELDQPVSCIPKALLNAGITTIIYIRSNIDGHSNDIHGHHNLSIDSL
jgi:hypothetical protein